jgi:PucR C-terminal helix-turn-helix domain/GGDEF-like domain
MRGRRPWHDLPPAVAAALRPELGGTTGEIIGALREGVPAYARPLEGSFGRGLRVGVEAALEHFVAEIEAQGRVPRADVYVDLGRGEFRAGRSLEALLGAYRLGARVAWRRFAEAGRRAELDPDTIYALAESIFAYIDELSAESAEGYALEQSAVAGASQLRRRRLVRLLVREPPAEPDAVEAAAAEAGWPLPRALAALVVAGEGREDAAGRFGPEVATDEIEDQIVALVPDPDAPGRRAVLERAVDRPDATAALGPTVAWPDTAMSFGRARAALGLAAVGAVPGRALVVAADHGAALLLTSDPRLVADLVRDRLAPLDNLPAGSRRRLRETLEAWLAGQGRLQVVADRLGVHPQTVRYRLRRLRQEFGPALDDPDRRFELDLALRTRAFLAAREGEGDAA